MSRQTSLRHEWLIRLVTGIMMIPVALLIAGGAASAVPSAAQPVGLAVGGLIYILGSMAISGLIIHRKAK